MQLVHEDVGLATLSPSGRWLTQLRAFWLCFGLPFATASIAGVDHQPKKHVQKSRNHEHGVDKLEALYNRALPSRTRRRPYSTWISRSGIDCMSNIQRKKLQVPTRRTTTQKACTCNTRYEEEYASRAKLTADSQQPRTQPWTPLQLSKTKSPRHC